MSFPFKATDAGRGPSSLSFLTTFDFVDALQIFLAFSSKAFKLAAIRCFLANTAFFSAEHERLKYFLFALVLEFIKISKEWPDYFAIVALADDAFHWRQND